MSDNAAVELEKFREQWREEVTARSKGPPASTSAATAPLSAETANTRGNFENPTARKPPLYTQVEEVKKPKDADVDDALDHSQAIQYHDLPDRDEARQLGIEGEGIHPSVATLNTPSTALDHYEMAIEREEQGNLGDSVSLYRKAYRLDAGVDKIYRNKHFPPSSTNSKATNKNLSNASVTVPNTAHHSLDGPPAPTVTISQLIASFAGLTIPPAPPPTDQSPQPPCPISSVPSEILMDILNPTAIIDVTAFARLSLVCKHLAHLIATEDRIWKRVCLGAEYGFQGMHYNWNCSIYGLPLSPHLGPLLDVPEKELISSTATDHLPPLFSKLDINRTPLITPPLTPFEALTSTYPDYRTMFRFRPRIRFNGCYISTVNYIRPGGSTPSQLSWNTPVHIVTYYRYLRFFRDGSCVSLQTTAEPLDVVHHLTKANIPSRVGYAKTNPSLLPPMSIMQHALRGRWKLQSPLSETKDEPEGTVSIETLGIDPDKYIYVMSLALRSAGRKEGPRNNKLAWRGFWSYNKLADDWAEFGLRNDKPFFWSRVGSYGMGE
ncbi:MAG: hypothetical protein Q9195_009026 [Heterodermia aff. obscurata]